MLKRGIVSKAESKTIMGEKRGGGGGVNFSDSTLAVIYAKGWRWLPPGEIFKWDSRGIKKEFSFWLNFIFKETSFKTEQKKIFPPFCFELRKKERARKKKKLIKIFKASWWLLLKCQLFCWFVDYAFRMNENWKRASPRSVLKTVN